MTWGWSIPPLIFRSNDISIALNPMAQDYVPVLEVAGIVQDSEATKKPPLFQQVDVIVQDGRRRGGIGRDWLFEKLPSVLCHTCIVSV
jgi:hypothetical protein